MYRRTLQSVAPQRAFESTPCACMRFDSAEVAYG